MSWEVLRTYVLFLTITNVRAMGTSGNVSVQPTSVAVNGEGVAIPVGASGLMRRDANIMQNGSHSLLDATSSEDEELANLTREVKELRDVIHKGMIPQLGDNNHKIWLHPNGESYLQKKNGYATHAIIHRAQSLLDTTSSEDDELANLTKEVQDLRDVIHKGITTPPSGIDGVTSHPDQKNAHVADAIKSRTNHPKQHLAKHKSTHSSEEKKHKKKAHGFGTGFRSHDKGETEDPLEDPFHTGLIEGKDTIISHHHHVPHHVGGHGHEYRPQDI